MGQWSRYVWLILTSFACLIPVIWMIGVSLIVYPEKELSIKNYLDVWSAGSFGRYFLNSVLISGTVTAGNLIFCSMAGYFFARQSFPFKKVLFITVLLTLIIPVQIVMVPLYMLMHRLNWLDTYWALIVPWLVNPFGIFLMKQYFEKLPVSVEESARMDGAGDFSILFRIVMPMARPALAVLAIYIFVNTWNQFLFPFLFTDSDAMRTLPVGLAFFSGYQDIDTPHLMAGAGLSSIPMILIFLLFQREIMDGLTSGALKE